MAISTENITPDQLNKILLIHETHFADLKAIDISPSKLTKSIAAFANADGGELYIGIDENTDAATGEKHRYWRGFKDAESANGHLQAFEGLFPLGQNFDYKFLSCKAGNGVLLKVEVRKTRDIKKTSDGKVYIRRGAQSLPVESHEALKRLEFNKGISSFETETVNSPTIEITNSIPMLEFMLEVIPAAEPENWLRKQQLIREEKPTVAGVLLFAEEPQALLPKRCAIKVYRYKTKEPTGSRDTLAFDPITIEGNIYNQIKASVQQTVETIEAVSTLGTSGFERVNYPLVTLHEIITNAVLHRDYSIVNDVHVRVFDNRVEVESPGKLPAHITVQNILDEGFARNGTLVRLINKFPDAPNKDVGEGLNTAFEAMRKLRLKDPVIEEGENNVTVFIRHEPLASPEEMVMDFLTSHDQINNRIAREWCSIPSENVMKRVFERLIERGLIERVPNLRGKSTAYRKNSQLDTESSVSTTRSPTPHQLRLDEQ